MARERLYFLRAARPRLIGKTFANEQVIGEIFRL